MNNGSPKLSHPMWGFIFTAICAALVWRAERLPIWVQLALSLIGVVLVSISAWEFVNWAMHTVAVRMKELRYARVADAATLLDRVKGVTTSQLEFVDRQIHMEIFGIPGDTGIIWRVRFPGGDVDLEFVAEFLRASLEVPEPYLWPVNQHTSSHWLAWKDFMNVEEKLTIVTNGLKYFERADDAAGRYSAKLKPGITIYDLAKEFRVEL